MSDLTDQAFEWFEKLRTQLSATGQADLSHLVRRNIQIIQAELETVTSKADEEADLRNTLATDYRVLEDKLSEANSRTDDLERKNYQIESELIQKRQGTCDLCSWNSRDACSRTREVAIKENAELKEQLRPRKYPDEKPDHDQVVIHDGHTYRFDSNGDDPDRWDDGTYCEPCEEGDLWIPLPELVESPPTGEHDEN